MSTPATPAAPSIRPSNVGPFLIVLVALTAVVVLLFAGQNPWNLLFVYPLINMLVALDIVVFGQFGLAIIVFTLLLRLVTLPFTTRQFQSMKAMQSAQPQMQEIQKKYKDPKRRQQEMIKLYREHNINPLGCFMPFLIQMVVFIALYRALVYTVGGSPETMIGLSERLYPFTFLHAQVPLEQHFLWLNLGEPDTTFILPLLVGVSTYVQQKMSITPNATPQMRQQQQMMTWMLPMMLVFITLSLPSGVGIYWVVTNIFSLFVSYYVYGRSFNLKQILSPMPQAEAPAATKTAEEPAPTADIPAERSEATEPVGETDGARPQETRQARGRHGKRRGKRKNRR